MRKQDKKSLKTKSKNKKPSLSLRPLTESEKKSVTAAGPIGLGGYH